MTGGSVTGKVKDSLSSLWISQSIFTDDEMGVMDDFTNGPNSEILV